jgi:hypothetical protein
MVMTARMRAQHTVCQYTSIAAIERVPVLCCSDTIGIILVVKLA